MARWKRQERCVWMTTKLVKWAPTTARSSNRGCRMEAEQNFFRRCWGSPKIGSDTNAIWEILVYLEIFSFLRRGILAYDGPDGT